MNPLVAAELRDAGRVLNVTWHDGRTARYHALWLRDHALDAGSVDPRNGQRLTTILDLPEDPRIAAATAGGGNLEVTFAPDGRTVVFPADWLAAHRYDDRPLRREPGWSGPEITRWGAELAGSLAAARFDQVVADRRAFIDWLDDVRRFGVALMTGVPVESGAVCAVAELFGYVRETNYGRWFDVRAEVAPVNLAYTGLGLQVHTDNPYRDPVPTLQLLACLENSADGGDSTVVDGFKAAEILRREAPESFELLTRWPARFGYAGGAGVRLAAKRPILELGADGELIAVRFNNRSFGPLVDVPFDLVPGYYAACRAYAGILESPELTVSFRLAPGDLFIVDNTRVLHGRTAFSGVGSRWLQGCYADKDGLLSTLEAASG